MSPNLLNLKIDVLSSNDPKTFQHSLKLIASCFLSLNSLTFRRKGDLSVVGGDLQNTCLSHEHLAPLASLENLERFVLRYIEPVHIKNVDLVALLTKMSRLEVLELNPDPIRLLPMSLSIDVLPMIARACPKLRKLLLHLGETKLINPSERVSFKILSKIGFGTSPLRETDKHDVMVFLSQVLPEDCKMDCSWTLEDEAIDAIDDDVWGRMEASKKSWMEVARLLPLLMDVRRESIKSARDSGCNSSHSS